MSVKSKISGVKTIAAILQSLVEKLERKEISIPEFRLRLKGVRDLLSKSIEQFEAYYS